MRVDEILIGGTMEIEVKYNGKTMNFKSDIVDVKENSILISSIKVNDQTVGFSEKCQINFMCIMDNKVYIWDNVTIKLVKYDGAIFHKIDLNGEGKPYNRRDAFRMYIGEDMPLYVNTASGPAALSVLIKDISETGVGFITKDDIEVERTVRLRIKDNNTLISVSGIIVRKDFLPNLDAILYGCKFNEKNNLLGKYIAKKQAEHLRKKTSNYSSPHHKQK